jgi:hypothetical protein
MASDWHITHQKMDTVLNEDGNGFSQQWNVGYMVNDGPAKGVRGEIHVPNARLDPDIVQAAIDVQVRRHQKIAAL